MLRIESFTIKDWEEEEIGVFLAENDEWVLIKSIPVDFQLDGYKLIKKVYVEDRAEAEDAEKISKVFELRNINFSIPKNFKFVNTLQMLRQVEDKYGCFEFQEEVEDELFYGVLKEYDLTSFYIDSIKSDGVVDLEFDVDFKIKDVRIISFDSDYFNAMSLLYNYNKNNLDEA